MIQGERFKGNLYTISLNRELRVGGCVKLPDTAEDSFGVVVRTWQESDVKLYNCWIRGIPKDAVNTVDTEIH